MITLYHVLQSNSKIFLYVEEVIIFLLDVYCWSKYSF